MRKIVVFGATSAIADEAARCFAKDGDALFLLGRSLEKLQIIQSDLLTRGAASVDILAADFSKVDILGDLFDEVVKKFGNFDIALFAYGILGEQSEGEQDAATAIKVIEVNFLSVINLLTPLANYFAKLGAGTIAVITSVAGERGRKSNYIYGTSKGALSIFLHGLRNRLHSSGVTVLDIRPGFVDTPMTSHLAKGPLFASAHTVGCGVYRAILAKRDIVYLPWFWRWIMFIIKSIPETLFKRLSL